MRLSYQTRQAHVRLSEAVDVAYVLTALAQAPRMNLKPAKILIATHERVLQTVAQSLTGYELILTPSLGEAEGFVREAEIDLFVIGTHLDDSRAMSLVTFIRSGHQYKKTPILMVRLLPSDYEERLRNTLNVLKTMRGVCDYLELEDDPQAGKKIREAAEKCLPSKKRIDLPAGKS